MKKFSLILMILCMLLSGCSNSQKKQEENNTSKPNIETAEAATSNSADTESTNMDISQSESTVTVYPLPDSTMDTLDNATISVSLEKGDAYIDDTGIMRMDVKVYTYDLFDMVDIAGLKSGDTIVTHSGEVTVTSVERNSFGTIHINGGLDNGGFDLCSNDSGVYYEVGYNDVKNWYNVGEVTLRVSVDLVFRDNIDLEKGEQIYYAGSFLVGEVTDYHFTPYNTTIRTENGQIVSMERIYTP